MFVVGDGSFGIMMPRITKSPSIQNKPGANTCLKETYKYNTFANITRELLRQGIGVSSIDWRPNDVDRASIMHGVFLCGGCTRVRTLLQAVVVCTVFYAWPI